MLRQENTGDSSAAAISRSRALPHGKAGSPKKSKKPHRKARSPHGKAGSPRVGVIWSQQGDAMHTAVSSQGHRFHPLAQGQAQGQHRFNYSLISNLR